MDASQPSHTAQGAAMHRAAHQLVDRPPVFQDPLALSIIGSEAEAQLRAGEDWHAQPSNGLRAFVAARSRLAEDLLGEAVVQGVAQYVVLGAGLDTFAYRAGTKFPALKVFEVDHPATQGWKRARLSQTRIAVPDTVAYVAVDFERDTLANGLGQSGFDFGQPVFCAWLGVTPYLSRDTVSRTLSAFAQDMHSASIIVFDWCMCT
ncbi:MAG TPA: class I SAM-dependent methyltransferase [Rhizomicrobium sp.]